MNQHSYVGIILKNFMSQKKMWLLDKSFISGTIQIARDDLTIPKDAICLFK